MGSARRTPPRIVNTPTGPRERTRMAGESMERSQSKVEAAFSPRRKTREQMRERRMEERMERREERKQTFGDSFRDKLREERMSSVQKDEESPEKRRIFSKLFTRADKPERGTGFTNERISTGGFKSDRLDRSSASGGSRQVTRQDPKTGQMYGGLETKNPETGKFEPQYTIPTRATEKSEPVLGRKRSRTNQNIAKTDI